MNKVLSLATALAFVLGLATSARADDEKKKKKADGPDVAAIFAKLDANNDKKVSKDEFDNFKGLAAPKPGKENKEPKGIADERAKWFKALDANNDGSLSAEEFGKVRDVVGAAKKKKKEAK